jgi:hypothetical protein
MISIEDDPKLDGTRHYYSTESLGISDYSQEQISYHLNLLIEGKMVAGESNWGGGVPSFSRLTWEGHDFVASMRNSTVWEKAKQIVVSQGGAVTIVILKQILTKLLRQLYNLP